MESRLQSDETISSSIKRIIDETAEVGIEHIDDDTDRHRTVHEVRRRCKEIRAACRLVRPVLPTYTEENAHYRDAARRISEIRTAQASVEVFEEYVRPVAEENGTFSPETLDDIHETLLERREEIATRQALDQRLKNVRADLVEGRTRVPEMVVEGEGYEAVAGGLRKTYKRARDRMAEAYESPDFEGFHEWRKRIGYHRDHIALFENIWEGPMTARHAELQTLAESVGGATDLAEFNTIVHEEELFDHDVRSHLTDLIRSRVSHLQRRSRPLGERLFAEMPDQMVARFERYRDATREIDHDASDLVIDSSQQTSKPKPKPDPRTDQTETEAETQLPAIMQDLSDKWYEPDSDTYEYAVRTPDGTRAYRKTRDGAVSVLERYYTDNDGTE